MAITKIKAIHKDLNYCLGYAINPEKTDPLKFVFDYISDPEKSGNKLYVTGINCKPETAFQEMMSTKRRYAKEHRKVLGYHIMQSFKPGEVTPDLAHKIGCEFAERYLGEKYEAVVSTHLDQKHLHCHIMFNSVSFEDGMMYKNRFADYYGGIRKISDELCREHSLSVIDRPKGKGKHRLEWEAQKRGEPTIRSLLKEDIDDIISKSFTFQTFVDQLRKRGYKVKHGANVKHMAVRPPTGDRYIRLRGLGADYTEEAIRARLRDQQIKSPVSLKTKNRTQRTYRLIGIFPLARKKKMKGFMALYFHYLYLLGKVKSGTATKKQSRYLSSEMVKFKQYLNQHYFIHSNKIETIPDLHACRDELQGRISEFTGRRDLLSKEMKNQHEENGREEFSDEIQQINSALKELRRDLRMCGKIEESLPAIQEAAQPLLYATDKKRNQVQEHGYDKSR